MAGRFTVEAVFKAVDDLSAPVRRMTNRVKKFTTSAELGLRRVNAAANALTGAVVKVGGAASVAFAGAAGSVGFFVSQFSKIEDAQAAFTPLLGGAEKAKRLIDELNNTAATTPFQFENLASASKQLLPVMNGDIQKTVETLRMLGDTAGGNAQKLDSITRGFTKAMLKGKVDMESLNMIAEAGVPIFQDLAAVMGMETGEEFFKQISAGKVTTDQLTAAFVRLTKEGGKFHKGMEIASRTTSGMFSTLKDNIALTAAAVGEAMAPAVKELIGVSTEYAKTLRDWVAANRELIGTKFTEWVRGTIDLIARAIDFFDKYGAAIAKGIAAFVAFSVVVKSLIGLMTLFNLVMAANPIVLLTIAVVALSAALATLVTQLTRAIAHSETLGNIIDNVAGFLGFSGNDYDPNADTPRPAPAVVTTGQQIARQIEEQRSTETAELTIKDETGRAELRRRRGSGARITLTPTGAF